MCLGTLVQDGLAHMWGIIWRSVGKVQNRDV